MMNAIPLVRRQMMPMTTATTAPTPSAAARMQPPVADAVVRKNADRVRADTDVHRVAEAHEPAVAQDQVEADGRHRQDHDAREQGDVVRLADRRGYRRNEREKPEQHACDNRTRSQAPH
jgi:hypothetical protein